MASTFVGYSDDRRGPAYWAVLTAFAALGSLNWAAEARAQGTSVAPLAPQATPAPTPPAPQPAPSPPAATTPPAPPLSADYQAGFCTGWNAAQQVEQQRFGNWRALVMLGQPAPDSPAGVAVGSVPLYVLIQPLPPGAGLNLTDGRSVTCPAEVKK